MANKNWSQYISFLPFLETHLKKNKDNNMNTCESSLIFSGMSTKENNLKEEKKLFNIYQYCINNILYNKKKLCYDLFINHKYKDHPWTF